MRPRAGGYEEAITRVKLSKNARGRKQTVGLSCPREHRCCNTSLYHSRISRGQWPGKECLFCTGSMVFLPMFTSLSSCEVTTMTPVSC